MKTYLKRHFWTWFKKNHQEYLYLKIKKKRQVVYWLNELNAHLRAYNKFLGYTLEWRRDKTAHLVLTVHGRSRHFNKAESLACAAPKIPGWSFSALEEPRALDFLLEQEIIQTGVDPREFRFEFLGDDPSAGLLVYHPLCTSENKSQLCELATHAVFNLLGERRFGEEISYIDVENLSLVGADEVEPIEELPMVLALRRSKAFVDGTGALVMQ
jgi:hypothetical protein